MPAAHRVRRNTDVLNALPRNHARCIAMQRKRGEDSPGRQSPS